MNKFPHSRRPEDMRAALTEWSPIARSLRAMFWVGLAVLVLWFLGQVVLLVFAGGLFAILIAVPAAWLSTRSGIGYGWCVGAVLLLAAVLLAGVAYGLAPNVIAQVQQVETALPQDFARLIQDFRSSSLGHLVAGQFSGSGRLGSAVLEPMLKSLSTVAQALGSVLFVGFIGIYLAAAPRHYEKGLLALVPAERTPRAREIVQATVATLKYFLAGRLFSMAVIALCSALGLWLLGIPAPIALALIAGFLSFVPYIGSALSGVPPFLLAYAQSPHMAVYVIALYVLIHLLDGYILVPLVQRRMVHLAPALTLTAQFVLAVLWGILGIAVATPL